MNHRKLPNSQDHTNSALGHSSILIDEHSHIGEQAHVSE